MLSAFFLLFFCPKQTTAQQLLVNFLDSLARVELNYQADNNGSTPTDSLTQGTTRAFGDTEVQASIKSNYPLIVFNGQVASRESMRLFQINEIEKVTVFKTAAATNIYGDKGDKGVFAIQSVKNSTMRTQILMLSIWHTPTKFDLKRIRL